MAGEDDLARARRAIGTIESSNNYGIIGPATGGNVPLGRYQVMSSNLPSWSQEALGRQVSPQEYLSNPGLQDQLFNHHFGKYMDKYGPEGASRAWFGGEGSVYKNSGSKDILGTSVGGYGSKFSSLFNGGAGADGSQMAQGSGGPSGSPADAGFGHMSDDELKAIAAQPDTDSSDLSHMSDDELKAIAGGGDQAAAQATDSKEAQAAYGTGIDPATGLSDPLASIMGAAPGQAAAGRVFKRDALNNLQGLWDTAKHVVTDPVGSAKAVGSAVGVGAKKLVTDPVGAAKDVGNFAVDQFANPAKPATALLNIGSILVPGGVGRGALAGTTAAARGVDAVVAPTLGRVLTGVPGDLQREASAAALAGGERANQLRGQLRGTAERDAPVRIAEDAAHDIQQASLADRNATIADGAGQPSASPAGIQAALRDARAGNRDVAGIIQSRPAEEMLDALQGHVDTAFPGGRPLNADVTSVAGMDALKRRIGDELADRSLFNQGGHAGRLGGQVYHSVRQAITDAYPAYAPGMERAENAITGMQQMRRQLSLNGRNDATTAGALQRAARNDANGAYGMRRDQLQQLVQQRPELLSALAGQALSAGHPRGITPVIAAAAHGVASPITALLQYAAGIPRLHGEARYLLGAAVRRTGSAGFSQANIGRILDIARIVGTQNKDQ